MASLCKLYESLSRLVRRVKAMSGKTSLWRRSRIGIFAFVLVLLALVLPIVSSASIHTYCDSEGRLWVMFIDDGTGVMTGFIRTVNPSPECA